MTPRPIEHTVRISASIETVWTLLTEPDGLAQWWGAGEVDLRPGGRYRVEMDEGPQPVMRGTVVEVVVAERLVITFGWEDTPGAPRLGPDASLVEITLRSDGDVTVLTLRHEGLPGDLITETLEGWTDVLARLVAVAGPGRSPA